MVVLNLHHSIQKFRLTEESDINLPRYVYLQLNFQLSATHLKELVKSPLSRMHFVFQNIVFINFTKLTDFTKLRNLTQQQRVSYQMEDIDELQIEQDTLKDQRILITKTRRQLNQLLLLSNILLFINILFMPKNPPSKGDQGFE